MTLDAARKHQPFAVRRFVERHHGFRHPRRTGSPASRRSPLAQRSPASTLGPIGKQQPSAVGRPRRADGRAGTQRRLDVARQVRNPQRATRGLGAIAGFLEDRRTGSIRRQPHDEARDGWSNALDRLAARDRPRSVADPRRHTCCRDCCCTPARRCQRRRTRRVHLRSSTAHPCRRPRPRPSVPAFPDPSSARTRLSSLTYNSRFGAAKRAYSDDTSFRRSGESSAPMKIAHSRRSLVCA